MRRLAALYPDAMIAGILNRQGRTTAYGHRFEAGRVGNLRRHWDIPCFEPSAAHAEGEPLLRLLTRAIPRLIEAALEAEEQALDEAEAVLRETLKSDDMRKRIAAEATSCERGRTAPGLTAAKSPHGLKKKNLARNR